MPDATVIDHGKLYDAFVSVLERELGRKEEGVIHAIIGFEFGGPPDLLLFRNAPGIEGTSYVTSDPVCLSSENEWAEQILFKLSQASVEEVFDVGHTADITAWVTQECTIKGLLFTKLASLEFEGQSFGSLLCVGLTRSELDHALKHGSENLLNLLKAAGVFPVTDPNRASVI